MPIMAAVVRPESTSGSSPAKGEPALPVVWAKACDVAKIEPAKLKDTRFAAIVISARLSKNQGEALSGLVADDGPVSGLPETPQGMQGRNGHQVSADPVSVHSYHIQARLAG